MACGYIHQLVLLVNNHQKLANVTYNQACINRNERENSRGTTWTLQMVRAL